MRVFRVSAAARSDLDDIWLYIARDNVKAADQFIRTLVARFPKLAAMPGMGRTRDELAPNLRSFPVGHYVVFYRSIENGIEVVRVLHGARDLPPLFE